MKPSRDYSTMTRDEAVTHFGERAVALRDRIAALPLPQKFLLVAEFLEQPEGVVAPRIALDVARMALAELESRA